MSSRNPHFAHIVIERDKACQVCGSTENLQAHHIVPISEGGADIPENGEALCAGCHADKHPDVPRELFFNGASGRNLQSGWNATSVAAEIGCCTRTVVRAAHNLGISRVGSRWCFSGEEKMLIQSGIRSRMSEEREQALAVICEHLACNPQKIEHRIMAIDFALRRAAQELQQAQADAEARRALRPRGQGREE
jgi:hypothetical protein